jgi:uncharacterized protein
MFENPDAAQRRALLQRTRVIAVVGLSPNPARVSHRVAQAMQRYGYTIVPVHPAAREVLGERAVARLADIRGAIDLVNVFRRAEFVGAVVDECLALRLKAIWIQEGIVDEAAAVRAVEGGMTVVMDRCIYKDYLELCG